MPSYLKEEDSLIMYDNKWCILQTFPSTVEVNLSCLEPAGPSSSFASETLYCLIFYLIPRCIVIVIWYFKLLL